MTSAHHKRVAIIGAGLSGLSCASRLSTLGFEVRVFDKGRGPGGRTSTRRTAIADVEVGFDHGAQYFTVRDPELRDLVQEWEGLGVVSRWDGRVAVLGRDGKVDSYSDKTRFVGTPGMSAICKHLADSQDVRCGVRVDRVEASQSGAVLLDAHGDEPGEFDFVVVTAPPVQTAALLGQASPKLAARAASVEMKPCWAVMLALDSKLDVPYDGAFINEGPLSWIARTSSKPARTSEPERWVLHGSAPWSKAHLEESAEQVTALLLDAAFESMGVPGRAPVWASAHRWRYALADNPLDEGCLYDEATGIGASGDWTHGNRVEGAILSGRAMARRIAEAANVT